MSRYTTNKDVHWQDEPINGVAPRGMLGYYISIGFLAIVIFGILLLTSIPVEYRYKNDRKKCVFIEDRPFFFGEVKRRSCDWRPAFTGRYIQYVDKLPPLPN